MSVLVLLRHGQSQWNLENRFTGWVDVPLSRLGEDEARNAARLLMSEGFEFDVAFTSVLKRAVKTLWIVLEEMDQMWIKVRRSWRLNERMYGALQGLDKAETSAGHGEEQVKLWRRSFDTRPPPLDRQAVGWPGHDRRYARLAPSQIPATESLKDTVDRLLPYWQTAIVPALRRGQTVLVAAHGNTLRGLVRHLDDVTDKAIVDLNIPTGIPLVYALDDDLQPALRGGRYLGDAAEVRRASESIAQQGRAHSGR
jgi:2,3-bisphosphoglycerate-dependent phosphoglycerate mutase